MTWRAAFAVLFILVSGYVLWSGTFVALYAGHSLACAFGPKADGAMKTHAVAALWVLFVAGHAALAARLARAARRAESSDARTALARWAASLGAAAAVAALLIGLPILFVRPCL